MMRLLKPVAEVKFPHLRVVESYLLIHIDCAMFTTNSSLVLAYRYYARNLIDSTAELYLVFNLHFH